MEEVHTIQHSLFPVVLLLFIGVLSLTLTRPLRMSPIVGYLIAGALIGPHALHLIEHNDTTHLLAELGVVFLLFDIGLHFTMSHIWDARRDILGLGPLQMVLTTSIFAGLGMFMGLDVVLAIVIGAALALSSTAVVVQVLSERNLQNNPMGRSSTAVLVFQDICAIFLLILAASLDGADDALGMALGLAGLKAVIAFVAALAIGHYVIQPLFRWIASSNNSEVFTAIALLVVLSTALATGELALSLTLGAFLGGMMIAGTPYRHVIQTEVAPFRGLLLGFFFITVGMSLNLEVLMDQWMLVLQIMVILLLAKTLLTTFAALMMRKRFRTALQMGFLLSQGSEFAFVVLAMAGVSAGVGDEFSAVLIAAIAASMAMTPPLASLGRKLAYRWANQDWVAGKGGERAATEAPVMIVGMGEKGCCVADALDAHDIPYLGLEAKHKRFVEVSSNGYKVAFGDATDLRLMDTIRLAQTRTVIVTVPLYEAAKEMLPIVRQRYPGLYSVMAARDEKEKIKFESLGLHTVVSRSFPKGLELAAVTLELQNVDNESIQSWIQRKQENELDTLEDVQAHTQAKGA